MAVKKLKKAGTKKTKAVKRTRYTYALPTEKKEPDRNIRHYTMLLYGREKIGKTTLLSSFPGALFFTCEPGTKGLRIFEFNSPVGIDSWETFRAGVILLEKDREHFETIVVDTADRAFQMCQDYVCKMSGVAHPHDANDYGKTWGKVKTEFISCLDRIVKTGRGICMSSHAKEQEIETKSGEKYTRIFPTLSGAARGVVEGWINLFFFVDYMTDAKGRTRRVIVTRGDDTIWAGHQELGLVLPHYLPLKRRNGYQVLEAAFRGEKVGINPAELHVGRRTSEPGKKLLVRAKRKKKGGGSERVARLQAKRYE